MIYQRIEPCTVCGNVVYYNSELNELECTCSKSVRTLPKRTLEKHFVLEAAT